MGGDVTATALTASSTALSTDPSPNISTDRLPISASTDPSTDLSVPDKENDVASSSDGSEGSDGSDGSSGSDSGGDGDGDGDGGSSVSSAEEEERREPEEPKGNIIYLSYIITVNDVTLYIGYTNVGK